MRHARPIFTSEDHAVYDEFQFSPAVRAGAFIYISGVIGVDAQGQSFADPVDEYHATFRTIERLLAVEGATLADIVALDTFHVSKDLVPDLRVFNEVRTRYMQAPHPAWTAIGVAMLAVPGARAEVRVTAFLGNASAGG